MCGAAASFIVCFSHSFSKYLSSIYCVLGSVLGAECAGSSLTDSGPAAVKSANEWEDRQINKQTKTPASQSAMRGAVDRCTRHRNLGQGGVKEVAERRDV